MIDTQFFMELHETKTKKIRWVNVTKPGPKELEYLKKTFKFHPLDLEDCASPAQRPKIEEYPKYLFLVLLFPLYNRKTQEITPVEIDFFIGKNFLVTVHRSQLFQVNELFSICRKNALEKKRFLASTDELLYELLERLFKYTFPMLDHIGLDINRVQGKMFKGNERSNIRDILSIKRNIVNFRRIMQAHKAIIRRFREKHKKLCNGKCIDLYFDSLVDHTKDIWDLLTNYKDTIDALQDTNESLISFRLNDVMRLLTIISVVMLPAALVANIFGMNTVHTPILGTIGDFWILVGMMILFVVGMTAVFQGKKWL